MWAWQGRDVVDVVGETQEEDLGMEVTQRVVLGLDDVTVGTSVVSGPTDRCRAQCWWCQAPGSR